ncbi:phage head-tail connector protein, partial [Acinetobacter baumannii]
MPMITSEPAALAPLALAEARAFLNISRDDDDAVLIGHLRSAAELCEQFIGQSLLVRQHREAIAVSREWQ